MPPEAEVGPSIALGAGPRKGNLDKCGLYVDDSPPQLVALGRVYEGSTTNHNVPLVNDQVKLGVEEVQDADARVPIPTQEV